MINNYTFLSKDYAKISLTLLLLHFYRDHKILFRIILWVNIPVPKNYYHNYGNTGSLFHNQDSSLILSEHYEYEAAQKDRRVVLLLIVQRRSLQLLHCFLEKPPGK